MEIPLGCMQALSLLLENNEPANIFSVRRV